MTDPRIEMWPTGRPTPYENNPRINDGAVQAVANSIREFGFQSPIIVDGEGVIIAGHTRLKAAQSLGLERVPVIVAADLSDEQVKALRLADNKTGELADWDVTALIDELTELREIGMDLSVIGFDEYELTSLMPEFSYMGDLEHTAEEAEQEHDVDVPKQTHFSVTFTFEIENKPIIDAFIKAKGKDVLTAEILNLCAVSDGAGV